VEKEAPAPPTSVSLKVSPVAGSILVDGQDCGTAVSLVKALTPGKHTFEVRAAGYEPWSDEIEVNEGEKLRMDAKLVAVKKVEPTPPPRETPRETPTPPPVERPAPVEKPQVEAPPPPPAEKPKGKLSVNVSGGWADVFVDGKKVGTTPLIGYQLPAGTYMVRAKNDASGLDASKSVTVKPGENSTAAFSAN